MCRPPLYSIKPSFRNLVMNPLIRGRVVPTISARTSWLMFAIILALTLVLFRTSDAWVYYEVKR